LETILSLHFSDLCRSSPEQGSIDLELPDPQRIQDVYKLDWKKKHDIANFKGNVAFSSITEIGIELVATNRNHRCFQITLLC
jgi:hypothetical protein